MLIGFPKGPAVNCIDYDPSEFYFISGCGNLSLLRSPWNKLKSRKERFNFSHAINGFKTTILYCVFVKLVKLQAAQDKPIKLFV